MNKIDLFFKTLKEKLSESEKNKVSKFLKEKFSLQDYQDPFDINTYSESNIKAVSKDPDKLRIVNIEAKRLGYEKTDTLPSSGLVVTGYTTDLDEGIYSINEAVKETLPLKNYSYDNYPFFRISEIFIDTIDIINRTTQYPSSSILKYKAHIIDKIFVGLFDPSISNCTIVITDNYSRIISAPLNSDVTMSVNFPSYIEVTNNISPITIIDNNNYFLRIEDSSSSGASIIATVWGRHLL